MEKQANVGTGNSIINASNRQLTRLENEAGGNNMTGAKTETKVSIDESRKTEGYLGANERWRVCQESSGFLWVLVSFFICSLFTCKYIFFLNSVDLLKSVISLYISFISYHFLRVTICFIFWTQIWRINCYFSPAAT